MTISNDQALTLISYWYGATLDQVDARLTDSVACRGFVAWTYTAGRVDVGITVEGEDAIVAWLADDDLAREMGLLPECPVTVRSGSLPEMNVTVRLFDEGVEANRLGDDAAYRQARMAQSEGCAWATPWLRGWNAVEGVVAA